MCTPELEGVVIRSRENMCSIRSKNTGLNRLSMAFEGMKELSRVALPAVERKFGRDAKKDVSAITKYVGGCCVDLLLAKMFHFGLKPLQ
jgi:hypothetical protein